MTFEDDMTFEDQMIGFTPLHEAAMNGDLDRIRELLAKGVDPHVPMRDNSTPLTLACSAYAGAHMGAPYIRADKADDYMACALELADGDHEYVMSIVHNIWEAHDCL